LIPVSVEPQDGYFPDGCSLPRQSILKPPLMIVELIRRVTDLLFQKILFLHRSPGREGIIEQPFRGLRLPSLVPDAHLAAS